MKLAKRLLLAIASFLLTALVLEGAARIALPLPAPVRLASGIYVSQLPLVSGRDTVQRVEGEALLQAKRPGEKRVFVFGESSVQGDPWSYPGSPPTMLHEQLAERFPSRDVTIVNMGRGAASMRDSYYFLVAAARFSPDYVVYYQGGNDEFHDDPEMCLPASHPLLHRAWRFLVERSRLLWTVRALGPAAYVKRARARPAPRSVNVPPDCDPNRAFRGWTEILVDAARATGAEVIVTTTVENPLRRAERGSFWGVDGKVSAADKPEPYRRILACELSDGCDLPTTFTRERHEGVPAALQIVGCLFSPGCRALEILEQSSEGDVMARRDAIWLRTAAARGARAIDFHSYVKDRIPDPLARKIFTEEVHLSLEGYWLLAALWAHELGALLDGRSPPPPFPGPPPLDKKRYLEAVATFGHQPVACTLLRCADRYLRAGMLLQAGSLLDEAIALDALRPDAGPPSRAAVEARLIKAWLRRDLGLAPSLSPDLLPALDGTDPRRMADALREHADCSTVGTTVGTTEGTTVGTASGAASGATSGAPPAGR